jgi:hypothetical protein
MRFAQNRWKITLVLAVGLLGLTSMSCSNATSDHVLGSDVVHGSGVVAEESRTVGGITGVELAGIGTLYVEQGGAESLRIIAEDNLIQYLETESRGGTLVVRTRHGYDLRPSREIEYHLVVSNLQRAELRGAGGIRGSALTGNRLSLVLNGVGGIEFSNLDLTQVEVTSSGVGSVRLGGTVQTQSVVLGGLGSHEARDLQSAEANVTIRSGGSATVRVSDRLTARIDGGGSVYYIGNPVVTTSGNGSGSVVPIGG